MIYYKHLLLIDDDEDDHEFFREALREVDNTITCTSLYDGEMALLILKEKRSAPDLIILDTNMPKANGRQILTELKSDPELKNIPVIMYSTFISEKDNSELQQLGAAHYLTKPSKFEDFMNALHNILKRKWS